MATSLSNFAQRMIGTPPNDSKTCGKCNIEFGNSRIGWTKTGLRVARGSDFEPPVICRLRVTGAMISRQFIVKHPFVSAGRFGKQA